ncbi:hypothetical protein EUGRSUZ_C01613 [Eucalyptus grandis]|uniref:Uncharacterized protein n=2 Tax=Eucalyptus grandis TaxID=71139 RepID=A0ACC3LEA5_EUCGR|nr:hypothetical protein EUGRSUZ_C01613 [Eucalyptus grandis]
MPCLPHANFTFSEEYCFVFQCLQTFQHGKTLNQLLLLGPLITPPVNVTALAKVAVQAAADPAFTPVVIDVQGLLRYSQQKLK